MYILFSPISDHELIIGGGDFKSSVYIFNTIDKSAEQIIGDQANFKFECYNPGYMTSRDNVIGTVVLNDYKTKLVRFTRQNQNYEFTVLQDLDWASNFQAMII